MRFLPFIITTVATAVLIIVLSIPIGGSPAFGKFLSPQQGFWQNAEPVKKDFNLDLSFPGLKGHVRVFFDERLVPHVFAQQEVDLYFVQGYLHAKFRLWQMEFQTFAAAGRLSEILGPGENDVILNRDKGMRRLGMVFGAEKAAKEMETNPITKSSLDAYTAGINSYIENLKSSELPLEYKLLSYLPEKWSVLKSALFLKYMSFELAAGESDIEYTNAKSVLSRDDFEKIYPVMSDSLAPVVPRGSKFPPPGISVKIPPTADSLYFNWKDSFAILQDKPDKNNGSNNWAVAGSKTKSGRPILCNDPHLGLNMPSLWYEMQLSTPSFNAYGATFPGAPSIVIGFNDYCAWGFTNGARDVRDYYEIQFKDDSKKEYFFNGQWTKTELKIEEYKVKGRGLVRDTVAYTRMGPVIYDKSYSGGRTKNGKCLAVRWKANDSSNELVVFHKLNHAKNYNDYYKAIKDLHTPGQNCLFATKTGDIAIWHQSIYPAKWRRQGDFVMPGTDSTFFWQGYIPQDENPHLINPERGFVSSANQMPADTTYPYYLGGYYDLYRSVLINRYLSGMNAITIPDMERLQTENYNGLAEMAVPLLLRNIDENSLNESEKKYLQVVRNWNLRNDPNEKGPVVFNVWFDSLQTEIWSDELSRVPEPVEWPEEYTLIEGLRKDSTYKFIDNINTPEVETLQQVITQAFKKAVPVFSRLEKNGRLEWSKYKDTGIRHLLRLAQLSRFHLTTGGGLHVINAIKQFWGPSWRMVVELTDKTAAFGVYPGGQSGNPGSAYYDSFIDTWVSGKYYELWVMSKDQATDSRVKFTMTFSKE